MQEREAPTMILSAAARAVPAVPLSQVFEPNFGRLAADASWRKTWSTIVAGRFSPSPFSGLLFVERGTAYAELYDTDGQGRIVAPFRWKSDHLGDRATWTHIVPGYFGPSGLTGLLLYDKVAGIGRFYDCSPAGGFTLMREYAGWRTSWTHIVAGRFDASSSYGGLFFYSASENYAEIWRTDGKGLAGNYPYKTFPGFSNRAFTHVVAGDFHWTPGFIESVPSLTDLFFYDGNATPGCGEMYRCVTDTGVVLASAATNADLPARATTIVAGNFGGLGNTDLAFYDGATGTLTFHHFKDVGDTEAELLLRETQSGLRRSADVVVAGKFWMANPEDRAFDDGPPVASNPPFDPDWRYGTGGFSDLLLYDRNAGLGEFYFHEPLSPPAELIEGYVTSRSSHGGAPPVASGSVLPGEAIAFHVSSQAGPYSIRIYRQGFFSGGRTEELMTEISGLPADPKPLAISRNAYMNGAGWPAVKSFVVPDWPSGLYVARVQATSTPSAAVDLPFVVRAPFASGTRVLLVLADTSYCAYNDWGGRNSYGHLSGEDFVGAFPSTSAYRIPFGFQLSFERPSHGGFGNVPQTWEIPFIHWMARRGIRADVCTSRDLHFEAPSREAYPLLLFVGHHEYWTSEMRTHVESFMQSGGNVAFFTGNTCWWQVRLSGDGTRQSCYKVAGLDPVSRTGDHALTTAHWFDDLVKRPETTLTGVSWYGPEGIFSDSDHRYEVKQAGHWVFDGTGLEPNAQFGGYSSSGSSKMDRSVVGPETDRLQRNGPNGLTSPPDYTVASVYNSPDQTKTCRLEVGTMGVFHRGEGTVFNAATLNWASGLDLKDEPNVIDRITLNVLNRLGPHPPVWIPVSEGKSTAGAPVTAIALQSRIALFLADPGGEVFTTAGKDGDGWGPWTSVSEGSTRPGAPIAAVAAGDRVTVALADPAGGVYATSGNPAGGWGPWRSVSEGSTTPGAPIAAVMATPNRVTVVLADPAGGVYATSGNAVDGWGSWASVSEGSTTPGAPIAAVVTGLDRITLFLADGGGGVFTTSGNTTSGWGPWTSVSEGRTTPGGAITAVVTGPNRVTVFLADPAGGVYATSGNAATGWHPWASVSERRTKPGARVTAVATGPNSVAVFLADPAGGVYTTSGNTSSGWRPWRDVSEGRTTPGAPVSAVVTSPGHVALFVADPEGGVYTTTIKVDAS